MTGSVRGTFWTGVLVVLLACAAARAQQRPEVVPAESRMDAVFGRAVVFRVNPTRGRPPAVVEVRLDDGRVVDGHVQWVGIKGSEGDGCGGSSWLASPPTFVVRNPEDPDSGKGPGWWMMRLEYPLTASGQGFWLGGVRYEPNWLPDPRRLVAQGVVGRAWSSPLSKADRGDGLLGRLIEPYHDHPLYGWRYDLAMDVFTPGEEFGHAEEGGPITDLDALKDELLKGESVDPITADLARIERARWQIGLARLWNADPTLSLPVRQRLAGAIETSGGLVPSWVMQQMVLDDLLEALLDPRLSDEQRAAHTRSWLKGFDPAVAWVVDDAGRQDAVTDAYLPTIGVVNTSDKPGLAWADATDLVGASDLAPLMPGQVHMLRGEVLASRPGDPASGPGVAVQVGSWSGYLPVLGVAIPASPPGFALGPFRAEWTLASWRAMDEGAGSDMPRDQAAAVLLFKGPARDVGREALDVMGPVPGGPSRQVWGMYLEARVRAEGVGDDFVELWFGAFGYPTLVMRVYSDGRVTDGRSGKPMAGMGVEVFRLADRWVARLPLPLDVIEPGQEVKIGVLREDSCGVRSSWPRRMLPGQVEPGRVAVRLDAWDGYANR